MSKISIAMAVYNGEKYIHAQIDSILLQMVDTDELVISYDKSSDNTKIIIDDYATKDERIMVVENTTRGVASNFNNAIMHCTGDIIFVSDQDDIWNSNKLLSVKNCISDTGADLVIHNGIHVSEDLKPVSEPFFSTARFKNGIVRNFFKSRYSGCCMAFQAKMVQQILPIPPTIDAYDRWIGLLCECRGKVVYLDDLLIKHRLHSANVTPKSGRSVWRIVYARINLLWHLLHRLWQLKGMEK